MKQQIVALTGISGVGKTTFLRQLAEHIEFQHVTGGSLIASARKTGPEYRDCIRHADLEENQRLLIKGFALTRNPDASLVIMDGHVIVDDGETLSKISSEVFRALGLSAMVHLEAEPDRIAANRGRDSSRDRPAYPPEILGRHQELSHSYAGLIAETLGIPFYVVTHNETYQLAELLASGSKLKLKGRSTSN